MVGREGQGTVLVVRHTIRNFVFSKGRLVIADYLQNIISPPVKRRRRKVRKEKVRKRHGKERGEEGGEEVGGGE